MKSSNFKANDINCHTRTHCHLQTEKLNSKKAPLHSNMDKLLLHADTCDAKLVSSDHREFSVHKAVLALGSNVLKSFFFSQHKEASVYQMDCESNVVVHIIDFLYKGPNGMPQSWFNRFCDWHPTQKWKPSTIGLI